MEIKNRHVVVVGLGVTGLATAAFCLRRGARVTAIDNAVTAQTEAAADALGSMGARVDLGPGSGGLLSEAEVVVLSPGVPHDQPGILAAAEGGATVLGEIELASRFIDSPIIAVTGTNGKTSTTTLLGEMLRASGKSIFLGGNIGEPLIGFADAGGAADWLVLEISSFQTDTMDTFRPRIGVILNVSDDHLDRYPNLDAYGRSKFRLLSNQRTEDVAILNRDDPFTRSISPPGRGRRLFFGRGPLDDAAAGIEARRLRLRISDTRCLELDLDESPLMGRHNEENIAAAALAAMAAGASDEGIQKALRRFKGLPHRLEPISTVGGVRFVNDSKATNVGAVVRAVESFQKPVILIMGGVDKGGSYAPLEPFVRERIRRLILMGEAAPVIDKTLGCLTATETVATMAEAIDAAVAAAAPGDVVLLSPACSSFDMYANYAERGADFSRRVKALEIR